MRTLLVAGPIDGHREALEHLAHLVEDRQPQGVLYAGNILGDEPRTHADKLHAWEDFFAAVGKFSTFTAVIPGPVDAPGRDFLRLAKDAEETFVQLRVVHASLYEQRGLAICGVGSDLTDIGEADCSEERVSYSRSTAEYFLRHLWRSKQPRKILMLAVASPGRLGGDCGNRIAGDFIDSYHPSICVTPGPSSCRGTE
jgi:hypothetical protein